MTRAAFLCWGCLTIAVGASAQSKPDFTGTWRMDAARSESAATAEPGSPVAMTLVVTRTPFGISVETRRADRGQPIVYRDDGFETTGVWGPNVTRSKMHWDGPRMVIETVYSLSGWDVTAVEIWSLDDKAQEISIQRTVTVQHGYKKVEDGPSSPNSSTGTDVFKRQASGE